MATRKVLADLDFLSQATAINLPAPVNGGDAANKTYVDNQIASVSAGLSWKASVRAATTAAGTLASDFENGDTLDGVTLATGDRILIKNQGTASENGIYEVQASGAPTRTADADTFNELEAAVVTVEEGTSNAGLSFRQTEVNGTIGASDNLWVQFTTTVPSATESVEGVAEIATQVETDAGSDDQRFITPLKLANWSGRTLKFAQDIGNGALTSIAVTHNFGTRDILVDVYATASPFDQVTVGVELTDTNTVTLCFDSAPATNAYRVVIHA